MLMRGQRIGVKITPPVLLMCAVARCRCEWMCFPPICLRPFEAPVFIGSDDDDDDEGVLIGWLPAVGSGGDVRLSCRLQKRTFSFWWRVIFFFLYLLMQGELDSFFFLFPRKKRKKTQNDCKPKLVFLHTSRMRDVLCSCSKCIALKLISFNDLRRRRTLHTHRSVERGMEGRNNFVCVTLPSERSTTKWFKRKTFWNAKKLSLEKFLMAIIGLE